MFGGAKAPAIGRLLAALQEFSSRPEALTARIEHCRGSQARPMSDADLSEKFLGQAAVGYRPERSDSLLAQAWRIREAAAVGAFIGRWFDGP